MSETWLGMTACDLGRGIENGDIDPLDLTQTYLDAARTNAFRDTIYTRLTSDRALAEAKAASQRAKSNTRWSLLDGVPISWKDLYDTAGIATEAGSKLLVGRIPSRDALVLSNATARGLVCLGKTHLTELAYSGLGINSMMETPPNALNTALAPGGSSSGAAVSVAMNTAVAGIGSDTGGSVRVPAAWNNLVGFKTTSGVLSLEGVVPLCARFDTVGPLCRSVEDAAHLIAAMENTEVTDLSGTNLKGRRFAVCMTTFLDDCEPQIQAACDDAITKLSDQGCKIDHLDVPEVAQSLELAPILFGSEAYGTWGDEIEANPDAMSAPVRERFRGGRDFNAADYVRAWQKLDKLRRAYEDRISSYDAVLAPTSPILPPDQQRLLDDDTYFAERNLLALRNTRIGNLLGLCAVTLPTGQDHCGLMLMAPPNTDRALLRTAAALESVLG